MKPARYAIWLAKPNWTLRELSFLVKGFEPNRNAFGPSAATADPELKSVDDLYSDLFEIASADPKLHTTDLRDFTRQVARTDPLNKEFLLQWISKLAIVDLPEELASVVKTARSPTPTTSWPYVHDTKLLSICRWVIETHWEGQDPESAPKRDTVISELKKEFGISTSAAAAIDHVTRADSLKKRGVVKRRKV